MRINLLTYGLEESNAKTWEGADETRLIFEKFLTEGLKIQDHFAVGLVDIHRLPQHPQFKDGKKLNRSIIVKLDSAFSKRTIFRSLENLKNYNNGAERKVYVTEHLSQAHVDQKKKLLPYYKKARSESNMASS